MSRPAARLGAVMALVALVGGCGGATNGRDAAGDAGHLTLVLAAYTTPREAYAEIIPIFQERWRVETGQIVSFEQSYLGSGAQSRAIVEGFEADVAALSLEADIVRIEEAGLITHGWRDTPSRGMVSRSVVAFAVRPGNPKGIRDWADLARPDTEVLTPNPKTSGGAQWNIMALYGAAIRGHVDGVPGADEQAARGLLRSVLANVSVMDKAARESITSFEKGIGDVAITYENEILVGRQGGQDYELVIPRSTMLIENPVAVIDAYAAKHGTAEAAEAFVGFLFSRQAQEVFSRHGLRSVDPDVAAATSHLYPFVDDLFTIELFGGWEMATAGFFGADGLYTSVMEEVLGR